MGKFILQWIFVVLVFSNYVQAQNSSCLQVLNEGNWLTASSENIINKIISSNAQIILVGEHHDDNYLKKHIQMLSDIKKNVPNLKYLFIEFPKVKSKPYIDEILGVGSPQLKNEITEFIYRHSELLVLANKLGLRIIPVDADWTWDTDARKWKCDCDINEKINELIASGKQDTINDYLIENAPKVLSTDGNNDRNQSMSSEILRNLEENEVGIFIVGTDHLYSVPGTVSKSQLHQVPELLCTKNINQIIF